MFTIIIKNNNDLQLMQRKCVMYVTVYRLLPQIMSGRAIPSRLDLPN